MLNIELANRLDSDQLKETMIVSFEDASLKEMGVKDFLPPGVKDGVRVDRAFENPDYKIYAMKFENKLVGGIICELRTNKENYLETLWIIPEYQDRKFGSKALEFLENSHPDTVSWLLETPKQSKRNRYFYEKHGYVKVSEESFENIPVVLYHYRKLMK